jgi:ABC-type sugar transport system substrate-binding protein
MKTSTLSAVRCIAALFFVVPLAAVAAQELGRIFALVPSNASNGVLAATREGLYLAQPDGRLTLHVKRDGGFVALAADPSDANSPVRQWPGGRLASTRMTGAAVGNDRARDGPESFTRC